MRTFPIHCQTRGKEGEWQFGQKTIVTQQSENNREGDQHSYRRPSLNYICIQGDEEFPLFVDKQYWYIVWNTDKGRKGIQNTKNCAGIINMDHFFYFLFHKLAENLTHWPLSVTSSPFGIWVMLSSPASGSPMSKYVNIFIASCDCHYPVSLYQSLTACLPSVS